MKIRLVVEYNGANFCGWQIQKNGRSIQAELKKNIQIITGIEPRQLVAAGRTDAGVHARAQVVSFELDRNFNLDKLRSGISGLMRGELAVIGAEEVERQFDARLSALGKRYVYTILNREAPPTINAGFVWHYPWKLNLKIMREAAEAIKGFHDFTSFRSAGCNAKTPLREILVSKIELDGCYIYYVIEGVAFLKQMVRIITGSLVAFGGGFAKCGNIPELITKKDRKFAGVTAPAQGLTLDRVFYPTDQDLPDFWRVKIK
ncbi:MAG TPA: tRNA pseudouridine(38-40) synthase TruA [Oligoflexia bacterium]|nr:tRNA pseudouridine(38-40) synthase TruA [Oligoflexia bacterium]HMP26676.1 tRNA pseudouridine(38-40) synthase TruA [Oligoflexia bacterium]